VLQGKLRHGGHPILRWCAANVTVEQDSNENLKPSKKKSHERTLRAGSHASIADSGGGNKMSRQMNRDGSTA
jgi:phage terminase large subunit-like protein